jgi:hypothetical protein
MSNGGDENGDQRSNQGCGSGLNPDSMTLWIRIESGFNDFVDPDPYSEFGSQIGLRK